MNGTAIEESTLMTNGCEEFFRTGKENSRELHVIVVLQSHADGTLVNATAVIGRTVDGINNPRVFMVESMTVFFLTKETASRQQCGQFPLQEFLNGKIGRSDDIRKTLLLRNLKSVSKHQPGCFSDDIGQTGNHGLTSSRDRR